MALTVDAADFNFRLVVPERKPTIGIGGRLQAYDHVFEFVNRYANGTGSNKVDCAYSVRAQAMGTIDLRGSLASLCDGSTVIFPIVVGVFVVNLSTTAGEYIAVGGGSNPWLTWLGASGDLVRVGPGGFLALWSPVDGYATTAATGDILTLSAGAGAPTCDVLIVGRQS